MKSKRKFFGEAVCPYPRAEFSVMNRPDFYKLITQVNTAPTGPLAFLFYLTVNFNQFDIIITSPYSVIKTHN